MFVPTITPPALFSLITARFFHLELHQLRVPFFVINLLMGLTPMRWG